MTKEKEKALEFIENTIGSMRESSFKCKELCILVCSAFLTIFATVNPRPKLMILLCSPIILLFWIIDSFYLATERTMREEYKRVASIDFKEGDVKPLLFNVKLHGLDRIKSHLGSFFCSVSTTILYAPLFLASLVFGTLLLVGIL